MYFAIIGLKLDLIHGFSLGMLVAFLVGSCVVKILSVALAGRGAGFRGLDLLNLAITTNARGGPGIVPASVAFRSRNHQPQVLHDTGRGGGADFANGRCVARLRTGATLAAVDVGDGQTAGEESGHRNSAGSLKCFWTKAAAQFH
jgi:Kef-type K+ transport system membrane component KefB